MQIINELKDTLECNICHNQINISGFDMHIKYHHNIYPTEYYKFYYGIGAIENGKLLGTDILIILKLRQLYPQFNNDINRIQWLYDNNEYSYNKLIKKFEYNRFGKMCKALGIKINGKLSEQHKKSISKSRKGQLLSEEHKQKISEGYMNLPEIKRKEIGQKISNKLKGHHHKPESILKMIQNRGIPEKPFRGKAGMREDLGHFVRSTWEANFARILTYMNFSYKFEPKVFFVTRSDGSMITYTPDFKIGKSYVEVKGYWMDDALEKFELFKQQYPEIRIHLVDKPKYEKYKERFQDKISWEE